MASSISEMLSSFTTDIARPSRFDVLIPLPVGLLNAGLSSSDTQLLSMRCETAEMPSLTFTTIEQKFGSNPIEKYPHQATYNDLSLTFIVSGDMREKYIFDTWMNTIVPRAGFNPQYKYNGTTPNYATTVDILQYDLNNNQSYQVRLHDAYPIVVNQLDLDWSSDGHHKLTVVFAYTYWDTPYWDTPITETNNTKNGKMTINIPGYPSSSG